MYVKWGHVNLYKKNLPTTHNKYNNYVKWGHVNLYKKNKPTNHS